MVHRGRSWKTTIDGSEIDLVPWVSHHREELLLKPNDDNGGRGVVAGWTVDQRAWDEAIQTALELPYIVQRKVTVPQEQFPSFENDALQVLERTVHTNPYVAFGAFMHGCLTRLSAPGGVDAPTGGGSIVPTFLVEPREALH